jgi:hypothetical protein
MKTLTSLIGALVFCLMATVPARADVISDWIEAADTLFDEMRTGMGRHVPAQVALAMFEAVKCHRSPLRVIPGLSQGPGAGLS